MPVVESLAAWLEATRLAQFVGTSMWTIAALSAVHAVGYALVMGSALVAGLRLLGALRHIPVREVTRPASRGILLGLAISVITGAALVSFKASTAFVNELFQIKMLLLAAAALMHFTWQRRVAGSDSAAAVALKLTGAIGLVLWLGLAVAACAYILFE